MEPQHSALTGTHNINDFSTHRGQITDYWMCCPTRSMIFLLIVDKLLILDVLPHEINDFSTHRGQITDFGCVAPRDQ
ncbi:hypothetical protein TNCV_2743701 [Trichonephila clavipes]|nr:hypothetical protein TNCV_2743701 [Trichonephila clavipes]